MANDLIKIFPINIYHARGVTDDINKNALLKKTMSIFDAQTEFPQHPLETGRADSTYKSKRALDEMLYSQEIWPLASVVLDRAKQYWNDLGYEKNSFLRITSCWANVHDQGGQTLEHNHSPIHLNAVYYLEVPENSGDLILRTPLEYVLKQCPLGDADSQLEYTLHVQSGDLVILPGWLKHYVPISEAQKRRVVITFNINGDLTSGKVPTFAQARNKVEGSSEHGNVNVRGETSTVAADLMRKVSSLNLSAIRSSFVKKTAVTDDVADIIEREFLRFMVMCAIYQHISFPMGGLPDTYWHCAILHSRTYEEMCNQIVGTYLHHEPSSEEEIDISTEQKRISAFLRCYHDCFLHSAPLEVWPFHQYWLVHDPRA